MNKEELKKYVEGIDDNAEIIVINKDQLGAIPKHCERIDTGGAIIWVWRVCKGTVWTILVAWILQAPLDNLPKPDVVFLAAKEKIEYVVKHIDYSFPYTAHDQKYPLVAYEANGSTHYLPTSGLSPDAIAATGSFTKYG